jgi:hypothetical protein
MGRRAFTGGLAAAISAFFSPGFCGLTEATSEDADAPSFLRLSALVVGRPDCDTVFASRVREELLANNPQAGSQIAALQKFISDRKLTDVESLAQTLDNENQALASFLRLLVSSWYTGVVGGESNAKLVAYDGALMFDLYRDVVTVPSYCLAAPEYWTSRPPTG